MTLLNQAQVAEIAGKLTKRQADKLRCLNGIWQAGPDLPRSVAEELDGFRRAGLVERQFGDMGDPRFSVGLDSLKAALSACWFFRLTPLGLAVRAHLLSQDHSS